MDKSAEAHVTENRQDLFNTAINHLGNPSESVRLGGIYALYELARENQYRESVHEILCSHARSKTNEESYKDLYKVSPSVEIQSLVNLLVKQESHIFQDPRVNFEGVWLQGANLKWAKLQRANLGEAKLQGANLAEAQLQEAGLYRAQLQGVLSSRTNPYFLLFGGPIGSRVGKNTEVDGVVFKGINREKFAGIKKNIDLEEDYWDPDKRQELQELLDCLEQEHLNKSDIPNEKKIQYLEEQGAETGSYDKEDESIAEYEKEMTELKKILEKEDK